MKKMISATLLALVVGSTFALPVQEAVAATGCRYVDGKRVCGTTTHPRTVCTTTGSVLNLEIAVDLCQSDQIRYLI